jgi:hypothetical protein
MVNANMVNAKSEIPNRPDSIENSLFRVDF